MDESRSIADELDALETGVSEAGVLETIGRVSVSGQRPVHAGFGFSEIKRDEQPRRSLADAPDVAEDLDAALDRLRSSTPAE